MHLSSEPGRQSSSVRASKADPGVPAAQVEVLADVLVKNSQVSKPGGKVASSAHLHLQMEKHTKRGKIKKAEAQGGKKAQEVFHVCTRRNYS